MGRPKDLTPGEVDHFPRDHGVIGVDDVGIDITARDDAPPSLESAVFVDVNGNGRVDSGDRIRLRADEPLRVSGEAAAPNLPVAGDRLGTGATTAQAGEGRVDIVLGALARLTPAGAFDPARRTAGSPTGLALAGSAAITDVSGLALAFENVDLAAPADAVAPRLVAARLLDIVQPQALSIDAGDVVELAFDAPVRLVPPGADASAAIVLAGPGALGSGAQLQTGRAETTLQLVLGSGATLNLRNPGPPAGNETLLSLAAASGLEGIFGRPAVSPQPLAIARQGADIAPPRLLSARQDTAIDPLGLALVLSFSEALAADEAERQQKQGVAGCIEAGSDERRYACRRTGVPVPRGDPVVALVGGENAIALELAPEGLGGGKRGEDLDSIEGADRCFAHRRARGLAFRAYKCRRRIACHA